MPDLYGKYDKRPLLRAIYETLYGRYGPQHWWPARSGSPWETMIGAVLTQRTSWHNVELALDNIEGAWGRQGLSEPRVVLDARLETLVELLRPAGHITRKPLTLQGLARFAANMDGLEALVASPEATESLRERLLSVPGIGPETADAILLYALNRPVFVADGYALRLASRWGFLGPRARYSEIQKLFMESLPHDVNLYKEYHALIVAHGKELCRPQPICARCPLSRTIQTLQYRTEPFDRASWQCPWPLSVESSQPRLTHVKTMW